MRRPTILTLLLAAVMSVALFFLKYEVIDLEQKLGVLNKKIVQDQEAIHVLNAEWSHLNNANRIKDLATRYLEMTPTNPKKLKNIDDLTDALFENQLSDQEELGSKAIAEKNKKEVNR